MEKEKSQDSLKRMDKKAFRLGLAAIVGILGLPFVVTQCTFGYELGVNGANEIGDTLGGVLGPFIGLISASLVYLALREQIKANNLIQEQFRDEKNERIERLIFEEIIKELDEIINRIENFTFNYLTRDNYKKGKEAFQRSIEITVFEVEKMPIIDNLTTFKTIYFDIIAQLELFTASIKQEIAYFQILNTRLKKIENYLNSVSFSMMFFKNKYRYSGNDYLNLKKGGLFDELHQYLEYSLAIKLKLQQRNEIELLSNTLIWYNKLKDERQIYFEFKERFKHREMSIYEVKNRFFEGKINDLELSNELEKLDKVVFKDLEINYSKFINELNDYDYHKISLMEALI